MNIIITKGTGEGRTEISAFDRALKNAGICNYNLIALSSIIPPNSKILKQQYVTSPQHLGYKLYCVISKNSTSKIGEEVWSGVGWSQDKIDKSGIFVEIQESNEDRMHNQIEMALLDMQSCRLEKEYGKIQTESIGIKCIGKSVCSVVVAVYKFEDWSN